MRKTVIKRRKRVPAAAGAPGSPTQQDRMSDQAAAEVLASVRGGASGGAGTQDESEEDQPKRKRARKSRVSRKEGDDGMDVDEDDGDDEDVKTVRKPRRSRGSAVAGNRRGSSRESAAPVVWGEIMHPQSMAEAGPSASPHASRAGSTPAGAPHGHPFPNPHGGYNLPPLTAAINGEMPMAMAMSIMNMQGAPVPGATPNYARSGSQGAGAPSRTHSPLAGPGMAAPPQGYVLPPLAHGAPPPPHTFVHHHPHAYYAPPPGGQPPVPSTQELERHYNELAEQRRRLEEMMEKTDRMMAGVRRGLDDMRMSQSAQASPSQSQAQSSQAASVPLSRGERPTSSRESIWPVAPPEASPRETNK
ncbi:hypothetical protein EVJ58_g4734 [Rhodofomes roseus]|uniref:Uncharacterized protein n=1 Tax=Rhodofomes roseus TaxID=34475 RepID=A0A4Y9YEU0_9APHY|nr:hypothetical protein EVJ58_g4734 [Rhodofomes roseus]